MYSEPILHRNGLLVSPVSVRAVGFVFASAH